MNKLLEGLKDYFNNTPQNTLDKDWKNIEPYNQIGPDVNNYVKFIKSMKKYKVLFCDLDGTLIDTISGETFPKGIWDMKLKFDVLDAIKKLAPEYVFIISNQDGIEKGFVNERNFQFKSEFIRRSVIEYLGMDLNHCNYQYCPFNAKSNSYRKPNTDMLSRLLIHYIPRKGFSNITKIDCLMIGNTSSKEGQFLDTNKKTAENFGIDYLDVNDFVKLLK